ncbi:hypothetical protein PXD04_09605 [Methanosphaera sp. ISO3-F5]|uniref:hypothetical protein n=1 Tax=Methanosphaera sp. ISO3-F5 TaxID=1452353 RepID=UPI002B2625C1|nr:hypothetical protein [Methanosphaera sp. ISO3-F5]WQH63943.1 hypothetical protein PXD04_09605 [Methanosphaera sp. ISO3-F5]
MFNNVGENIVTIVIVGVETEIASSINPETMVVDSYGKLNPFIRVNPYNRTTCEK